MGRDATARCVLGPCDEMVRATLESSELILRGASIRRRWPLTAMGEMRVDGERLHFAVEGAGVVTLYLGERQASAWARKILTPPPTLADKLGASATSPAMLVVAGTAEDGALAAALQGATTRDAALASQLIAVVLDEAALAAVLALHATMQCRHVWMVHRKGKGAQLGAGTVRATMRACGYIDTKVSAVSNTLSATRYTLNPAHHLFSDCTCVPSE